MRRVPVRRAGGSLSHSGQQGLADAVARAYKQELPSGGFVWQVFDAASHAQLTGVTLARWALLKFGSQPRRKTVSPRIDRKPRRNRRNTPQNKRFRRHDAAF